MKHLLMMMVLAAAQCSRAALITLMQEPFVPTQVFNSSNPDVLGAVVGNFYCQAVGPYTNYGALPGSSAVISGANNYNETSLLNTCATNIGMFGAWYYLDAPSVNSPTSGCDLIDLWNGGGSPFAVASIYLNAGLNLTFAGYNASAQSNICQVPIKQWFWIGMFWTNSPTTLYSGVLIYTNGVFVKVGAQNSAAAIPSGLATIYAGDYERGLATMTGRYGFPTLYTMATTNDIAYPTAVNVPPTTPNTWYVSQALGNDTNTGLVGFPWQTVTNLNWHETNCGVMASATNVPGMGDIVIVDNTMPLDIGSNQLVVGASGQQITFTNGPLKTWSVLQSSNWTQTTWCPNVYQQNDNGSFDLPECVLWENYGLGDVWLVHSNGAAWLNVSNYINAVAGSFWCDGVNVYIHPLSNTIPSSDGFTYKRSRNRNDSYGGRATASAIVVVATNVYIDGPSNTGYTTLCGPSSADPGIGEVVQFETTAGGTNIIANFGPIYWSKHGIAVTPGSVSGTYMQVTRSNGFYGPGSPYVGFGGQTCDVDYSSGGVSNVGVYINIQAISNIGNIGTSGGIANSGQPFWTSHGTATNNFVFLEFSNVFTHTFLSEQNTALELLAENSTFGSSCTFACDYTMQDCVITNGAPFENDPADHGMVSNCVFLLGVGLGGGPLGYLSGTETMCDCTIYTGKYTNSAVTDLFSRLGPTTFNFYNNTLYGPGCEAAYSIVLLDGFFPNDTLNFSNNTYHLPGAANLVDFYNVNTNYTFAQWQAAGFDRGSVNSAITNYYVAQTAQGFGTGDSATNADSIAGTWFTAGCEWVAGLTWQLVGAFTTPLVIPNSVTNIGDYAFTGCSELTSITIPAGVSSIGDYAFSGCTNLTAVYFTGNCPSANSNVFQLDDKVTVYYSPGSSGCGSTFAGVPAVLSNSPRQATAMATITNGFVVAVTITDNGFGYTNAPLVYFLGGGGTGARAVATVSNDAVTEITVTDAGFGYTNAPTVVITPPFPLILDVGTATYLEFTNLTVGGSYQLQVSPSGIWTNLGSPFTADSTNYSQYDAGLNDGSSFRLATLPIPTGATATPILSYDFVVAATVTDGGSGYVSAPGVQIIGGGGSGAAATATVSNGMVIALNITDAGFGYTSPPTIQIDLPPVPALLPNITNVLRLDYHGLASPLTYQLQASPDLVAWTNFGAPFVAEAITNSQYVPLGTGCQYFRLSLP